MSKNYKPHFDEELSNVFLSFKKDMLPSDEINENIVNRLRAEIRTRSVQHTERRSRWKGYFKIRIPLATAASMVLFFGFYWLFVANTNTASADFGEMLKRVREATSVLFDATYTSPDKSVQNARVTMTHNGQIREDWSDGRVAIFDYPKGKYLVLTPLENRAVLRRLYSEVPFNKRQQPFEPLETLRKSIISDGTFVGTEMCKGEKTDLYHVSCENGIITVWVDIESQLPIQIERRVSSPEGTESLCLLDNFQWNLPISESYLSLNVPQGYVIEEMDKIASEESLRFLLHYCAKRNDGFFPTDMEPETFVSLLFQKDGPAKMHSTETRKNSFTGSANQEMKEVIRTCYNGWEFIQNLKDTGTWRYVGKNVQLGNETAIVCFWILPDSSTYRLMLGDLSIRDMSQKEKAVLLPDIVNIDE